MAAYSMEWNEAPPRDWSLYVFIGALEDHFTFWRRSGGWFAADSDWLGLSHVVCLGKGESDVEGDQILSHLITSPSSIQSNAPLLIWYIQDIRSSLFLLLFFSSLYGNPCSVDSTASSLRFYVVLCLRLVSAHHGARALHRQAVLVSETWTANGQGMVVAWQ